MLSWNHHSECKRVSIVSSFEVIALTHTMCVFCLCCCRHRRRRCRRRCNVQSLLLLLFMRWLYLLVHINCVVITSFRVRCILRLLYVLTLALTICVPFAQTFSICFRPECNTSKRNELRKRKKKLNKTERDRWIERYSRRGEGGIVWQS